MNRFELVVVILAIVFGSRLLRDYMRHRADARPALPDEATRLLVEEVARLRERVQVLERVVTDTHGSSDLERRIEALRDREDRA